MSEEYNDYEDDNEVESSDEQEIDTEDLLANYLETEDDEPEAVAKPEPTKVEAEVPNTDQKFKVKVNGQEQEVPLSELLNGYQRQSDYTSKTQALSQERQQVEAEKAQYNQYVQSIPMLAQVAQQNINNAAEQLHSPELLELAKTDPAEYVAQKAQIEAHIAENQKAYGQMAQQWQESQTIANQQHNQLLNEVVAESNKILEDKIDGWKDGSVKTVLAEYAVKNGFDVQELNNLYDHRQVEILNKARLYDEMMSKQSVTTKRVEKVPPRVLKPGNGDDNQDDLATAKKKALSRYNRGDSESMEDLIANMLG